MSVVIIDRTKSERAFYKNLLSIWLYPPRIFLLAALFVCILFIYLLKLKPKYISLPIHAPEYYQEGDVGDWQHTTYSVYVEPLLQNSIINGGIFIQRKEAWVLNEEASWGSIAAYFDNQLDSVGWTRSDAYAPCKLYMPEANFLPDGKNGFLYYRRNTYKPMYESEDGDLICLAIWKPVGENHFNIVLITAKPSLLVILNDLLG